MKRFLKSFVQLSIVGSVCCSAAGARNTALERIWKCGPYSVGGPGFLTTVTDTSIYDKDGSYRETSEKSVRLTDGRVVNLRDRSFGTWVIKTDIIEIRYDRVEFLSSDDPAYTVKMGQADADAQQKKKNWSKSKIRELGDKLVTFPVESMYKGAEVQVTCVRP